MKTLLPSTDTINAISHLYLSDRQITTKAQFFTNIPVVMTEWLYDYLPQYILLGVRLGDFLHKTKAMKDPLIAQVLYELHSVISNI